MIDELRERFRDRFIDTARQRLSRGTAALESASGAATVRHELHALAGEASMLGLEAMSHTARDGEAAARRWEEGATDDSKQLSARALRTLGFQLDAFAADGSRGVGRAARPTTPPDGKRRVLVIDDSLIVAEQLCDELEAEGLETRAAANAAEAVASMIEFRPHVVASDVMIPGVDIGELCARLRAALAGRPLSIVLVSGIEQGELTPIAESVGADAAVSKRSGLVGVVESIINLVEARG